MRNFISSAVSFSSHFAPVSAPVSFSAPAFAAPAFGFAGHSWGKKTVKPSLSLI